MGDLRSGLFGDPAQAEGLKAVSTQWSVIAECVSTSRRSTYDHSSPARDDGGKILCKSRLLFAMESTEHNDPRSLPVVADISREIVGIHASHYGRGPTKAKTIWREDIIVCVLQDIFTKSEQVLIDAGKFEQVRANRQIFQDAVEPLLRQVVEQATGSTVRSFLSQVSVDGTASEVFLLDRSVEP
jgi:uncharacterized protein YbcI